MMRAPSQDARPRRIRSSPTGEGRFRILGFTRALILILAAAGFSSAAVSETADPCVCPCCERMTDRGDRTRADDAGEPDAYHHPDAHRRGEGHDHEASHSRKPRADSVRKGTVETEERLRDALLKGDPAKADRAGRKKARARDLKALNEELVERWGIEVVYLGLTSAGYMVDFRYRVVDPERARVVTESEEKPLLVDLESDGEFRVPVAPKLGELRKRTHRKGARPLRPGQILYMLFANPGRQLRKGQVLSVKMGDFEAEGIALQ